MGSLAFFISTKLMITLPNYSAVFTVGMPYLRTIPTATLATLNLPCKYMCSTMPIFSCLSGSKFSLHHVKYRRVNNGLMVIFYIVLRNFSFIYFLFFG